MMPLPCPSCGQTIFYGRLRDDGPRLPLGLVDDERWLPHACAGTLQGTVNESCILWPWAAAYLKGLEQTRREGWPWRDMEAQLPPGVTPTLRRRRRPGYKRDADL